ncbi:hypothetical protein BN983_02898 [Halobacillus karajensis]|uniref:Uncharacterized protein n=1 Tax=Halobacillus karajensis TaxID=195088 RepID=A0A024P7I2_9BACI|nr:hypothetical protein BN983_02898 [Halobacillus karajensis]CDQ29147.1 hypothetical protein BN981_03510 [Halobacillus karajensis]
MTLLRKNGRSETPQCGFHEEARAFVRGKGMVCAPGGKKKASRKTRGFSTSWNLTL